MVSAALVFAGKSVAAPVIKEIVTKAMDYLGGYFTAESMREMRSKLDSGMPKIQAVLDVVSPEQLKDKSKALDDWFWQLRSAVEEAEDAIDELEYYELEQKAIDRKVDDWGSCFAKMKRKVAKSVKHVSVLDKVAKQFTHRDTIKRLKKAMDSINNAAADITSILAVTECLNNGKKDTTDICRETGSMLTAPKFVGREVEKERITAWLKEPEIGPTTAGIPILSIVGHGGMGKTTLVQSILKQEGLKDFKTIWVTVSTDFDATSVISTILESITRKTPSAKHLEPLQKELEIQLVSDKFLLILDDVWEEKKRNEWEKLFAPLRIGKSGSKILLTTRMTSVAELAADVMQVKRDCLTVEELKEDQSLELFNYIVFPGPNSQGNEQLKLTGEQIARKLGGCPLVIKVAGGHLQDNMTSQFWNSFLHEDLEHFKGTQEDVMSVLRLSYYHLRAELQICFRYCSLFSKNKKFKKEDLVQLWMGSGLLLRAASDSRTLVDIGEQHLARLTRKSFFELKYTVSYDGAKEEYYVMHDLIHDLATNVSFGECARITHLGMFEKEKDTLRHLLIVHPKKGLSFDDVKKMHRFKNLRTIIIYWDYKYIDKDIVSAIEAVVESSKSLRLFNSRLEHTSHFGEKLGNLKHLRYIQLSRMSQEGIRGIVKLYHLMVLKCYQSLKLKTKQVRYLGNLDGLRYVSYGVDGLGEFPVKRLTCLQKLKNYRIHGSIGNKISAISDLRDLCELELRCLENVRDQEEASSAKLNEKQYLNSLSLEWSESSDGETRAENSELVLEHLQPHCNIQKLVISGYRGLKFPCWIENPSVKNLVSLKLEKCINCQNLAFVGELVLLKYLELQQIGRSSHMSGSSSTEMVLPPSLYRLEVRNCPKLRELPILPPSLVSLSIESAGLTTLPMISEIFGESTEANASQLHDISISGCPHLTSVECSLLQQKLGIGSLSQLVIRGCKNLESASLPFEEMSRLTSLEISGCPKLRMMRNAEDKLLPSSLALLSLGRCGDLNLPLLGSLQGLTDLCSLKLWECPGVVSLPSADMFKSLTSLRFVKISACKDLSSLGGLRGHLNFLSIRRCSKLVESPDASAGEEGHLLHIESLVIDLPSLLLVEPLKSLCHTRELRILDGSEMEALPERWLLQNRASLRSLWIEKANSLESLPSSMRDLSCLKKLILNGAAQLQSLPDLPSSLQLLILFGCGSYVGKLKEYGNPERNKISHIPRVLIGRSSYFIMGKECSQETYHRLRQVVWVSDLKIKRWRASAMAGRLDLIKASVGEEDGRRALWLRNLS